MRSLTLFILTLIVACATEVPTSELGSEVPPFLKRYKKRNKELLYVVPPSEDELDLATKEIIYDSIRRFNPEIIIANFSNSDISTFQRHLDRCELAPQECSPAGWACRLSKPRGIPCTGGEPYPSEIVEEATSRNINPDEVLFFYVYQELVESDSPRPLDLLPKILEEEKESLNLVSRMDKETFLSHYREKMGNGPVILSQKNLIPGHKNYLQKLASTIRSSYETLILKKIKREQTTHERVLVIYPFDQYKGHLAPLERFFSTELP